MLNHNRNNLWGMCDSKERYRGISKYGIHVERDSLLKVNHVIGREKIKNRWGSTKYKS